jgi:hypothetical protein
MQAAGATRRGEIMHHAKRILMAVAVAIGTTGCGEQDAGGEAAEVGSGPASGQASLPAAERSDAASASDGGNAAAGDGTGGEAGLGLALDQPQRYYGVYASPDRLGREWFVAEARHPEWAERAPEVPPGHLMLGAKFGDVAPWHLKTLSDTEFVQARMNPGQDAPIRLEFRLGDDGRAEAFRFSGGPFASDAWIVRTGDLPEGW